jgi:hypothetical protein
MNIWDIAKPIILGVCRRRKRLAIFSFLVAALVFGSLGYYLSQKPPHFRTSATILLEARPDRPPSQEFSPSRPLPFQLAILAAAASPRL